MQEECSKGGKGEWVVPLFVPQPTSLNEVLKRLSKPDHIFVAGTRRPMGTDDHLDGSKNVEDIVVYAAPADPLYQVGQLNVFAEQLARNTPGVSVKPARLPDSWTNGEYVMFLGGVSFCDIVGRKTEIIDLAESGGELALLDVGKSNLRAGATVADILRTTNIKIYPHSKLAKAALYQSTPDLESGYIRRVWIDRLMRGEDPFEEPPSVVERAVRWAGRTYRLIRE